MHYPAKDDDDQLLWWWRRERPRLWDMEGEKRELW